MTKTAKGGARPGAGRKPYAPTPKDRAVVAAMIGYGIPHDDVAAVLGIGHDTLRKYFRKEIDTSAIKAKAEVLQSLHWMATKGRNPTAAIFLAKTRCGMRDVTHHEHGGEISLRETPTDEIERELFQIRSRKAALVGTGALAAAVQDKPSRLVD